MPSSHSINQIIDELLALDPSLAQDRATLEHLVTTLLESRPMPPLTDAFVQRLRADVLAAAAKSSPLAPRAVSFFQPMTLPKLSYVLGGTALAVLIILPIVFSMVGRMPGRSGILALGNQAFGSLSGVSNSQQGTSQLGSTGAISSIAPGAPIPMRTQAGGGFGGDSMGVAERATASSMIVDPGQFTAYRYVYRGEAVTLDETTRAVLRRVKGATAAASDLLRRSDFASVDLATLGRLRVQSLNLIPENSDGFAVYVDLAEGTASLNQFMPTPVAEPYQPLTASDVPADADLIAITNKFMADHRIRVDGYGSPIVQQENYRILAAEAQARGGDTATLYVPDYASVIYPQQHNGSNVVDEGGNPVGINVSLNLRTRQVTGVWNLRSLRYESSEYPAVTDFQRITATAMSRYSYPVEGAAKVVEVSLGTPSMTFATVWRYNGSGADELLVPALMFPVTAPEGEPFFYPKAVVVPLIQELLDYQAGGRGGDVMPLEKPLMAPTPAVEVKPEQ